MKKALVMLLAVLILALGTWRIEANDSLGDFGNLPEMNGLRVVGPTRQVPLWLKSGILLARLDERVGKYQIYQLQGQLPKGEGVAWLVTGTLTKEQAAKYLGSNADDFFANPDDIKVLRKLSAWSLQAYDAEPLVNEWLQKQISANSIVLEQLGLWRGGDRWENVPHLVTVQLRDFEPLRRVPGAYSTLYTAGERVILRVDGDFLIPLYVQIYLRQYQNQVRYACLLVADSERDYFKNTIWRAMKALPAN